MRITPEPKRVRDERVRGRGDAVEAVIFDWGGTLTPFHLVEIAEMWEGVGEALAPDDPEQAAALTAALLAADYAAWDGMGRDHTSVTLEQIFAAVGVEPNDGALRQIFDNWTPHTYTDPDVPALFTSLREQGIAVGILSNTTWPRSWHEQIFLRDGVLDLIDGAVYSSEIAWAKPHPEAFRAAMAAVGAADPARIVFVGDQLLADVHGAKQLGMRAVHVPHSTGFPNGDHEPDAVIQRLSDLLPLVESWHRP